jgi:hypothetical protein
MRYKEGDKVVIVSEVGGLRVYEMIRHLGRTMTISKVCTYYYRLLEDTSLWPWDDNMIDHEATAKLSEEGLRTKHSHER